MAAKDAKADGIRPEVRKVVTALANGQSLTLVELRAVLRAALTGATGRTDWVASVTAGGRDRVSLVLFNDPPAEAV